MRINVLVVIATVLLGLAVVAGQSQDSQQPSSAGGSSASSALDIQGIRAYVLGPGDVVEIRVFGQPDLSSTAQVD